MRWAKCNLVTVMQPDRQQVTPTRSVHNYQDSDDNLNAEQDSSEDLVHNKCQNACQKQGARMRPWIC